MTAAFSLDFETTSAADLKAVGAFRYAQNPTTRVLCWSVRDETGAPLEARAPGYLPDLTPAAPVPEPGWLRRVLDGEAVIHAYNAPFEWAVLTIACPRLFGWRPVPPEAMRCTAARARYWGYGGGLDDTSRLLGAAPKDMAGKKLMQKLAKPRRLGAKSKIASTGWWDMDEPELLADLLAYCEQDTLAEWSVGRKLPPLPASEQRVFETDLRMNATGVRMDRKLVGALIETAEAAVADANRELVALTRGSVETTNQVARLLGWINARIPASSPPVPSLAKEAVATALADPGIPAEPRRALELRALTAKSSTAKLVTMLGAADPATDMLRGLIQYYGAARTGRYAGRIVQPQNFPRGQIKNAVQLASLIEAGVIDPLAAFAGAGVDPMAGIASLLRACLIPDEYELGGLFLAPDYSQIEARVIAWLAGATRVLVIFASGQDIYVYTAASIGSDNRQLGKVIVLALGYGMGAGTFIDSAQVYGIELDPLQAEDIVTGWRAANPEIVGFWYALERAAREVVARRSQILARPIGQDVPVAGRGTRLPIGADLVRVWGARNAANPHGAVDLHIELPSTRRLVYPNIRIESHPMHGRDSLCFDGLNPVTSRWGEIFTYSGKLAENVTQAVARDLMALALVRLEDWGGLGVPRLTIHDEAVLDVPARIATDPARLANTSRTVAGIMDLSSPLFPRPRWTAGLPLAVGIAPHRRYTK